MCQVHAGALTGKGTCGFNVGRAEARPRQRATLKEGQRDVDASGRLPLTTCTASEVRSLVGRDASTPCRGRGIESLDQGTYLTW